jgi:hypothetical protein
LGVFRGYSPHQNQKYLRRSLNSFGENSRETFANCAAGIFYKRERFSPREKVPLFLKTGRMRERPIPAALHQSDQENSR